MLLLLGVVLVQSGIHLNLLAVSCIVFVQRIHGIWFEGSEACRAVDLALCRSYFMRTSSLQE